MRFEQFLLGLKIYLESPLALGSLQGSILWQEGTTRVLDYGARKANTNEPLLLFIPSLINRATILDLLPDQSLLRFLAHSGCHPLLLDWQAPGLEETHFSIDDYVARIVSAVRDIRKQWGRKIILAGYCMGGLLALAAEAESRDDIAALALLATPWDFHAPDVQRLQFSPATADTIAAMFSAAPLVPSALLHMIFYQMNPWSMHDKFRRLAALPKQSELSMMLIAREIWANEGVDMPAKIAHTTFVDWACHNVTMKDAWRVHGKVVDPRKVSCPTFIAMPKYDPIVPPQCAAPLARLIPHAENSVCVSGHVGMIVGKNAKRDVWLPLAKWARGL